MLATPTLRSVVSGCDRVNYLKFQSVPLIINNFDNKIRVCILYSLSCNNACVSKENKGIKSSTGYLSLGIYYKERQIYSLIACFTRFYYSSISCWLSWTHHATQDCFKQKIPHHLHIHTKVTYQLSCLELGTSIIELYIIFSISVTLTDM